MDLGTFHHEPYKPFMSNDLPKEFRETTPISGMSTSNASAIAIVPGKAFVWVLIPLAVIPIFWLSLRAVGWPEYFLASMFAGVAAILYVRRIRKWSWDGDGSAPLKSRSSFTSRILKRLLSSMPLEIGTAILAVLFLPLGTTVVHQGGTVAQSNLRANFKVVYLYHLWSMDVADISYPSLPGLLLGGKRPSASQWEL